MDPTQQPGQDPSQPGPSPEPQQPEPQEPAPQEPQAPEQQIEEEPQEPTRFERRQERQIERLTDRIAHGMNNRQQFEQPPQPPQRQPYQPLKYDEAEYDIDQLENDRRQFAESRYQEGIQAGQQAAQIEFFQDRLERDVDYVSSRNPQLDENSEEFNPDLADTISRMYLATIGFNEQTGTISNPGVRYRDYATAFMKALDKVSTGMSAESAQNLTRQSSQAGMRPTGTPRSAPINFSDPNAIANMSQEEYQANREAIQQRVLAELGQ